MPNNTVDANQAVAFITEFSQRITDWIMNFLADNNFQVSQRWAGMMLLFVAGLLVFLGLKATKPILKWALLIIGSLLIIGLFLPW